MRFKQDSLPAKSTMRLAAIAALLAALLFDAAGCTSTEEAPISAPPASLPRSAAITATPRAPHLPRPASMPQAAQPQAAPPQAVIPLPQPVPPTPLDPAPKAVLANEPARIIKMEVTAYCPCKICCGKRAQGRTASGKTVKANGGAFVAADTKVLPFHTKIVVPGYRGGKPVPVLDRGGDIVGNRLDVFFSSHADARKWGRRVVPVTVMN